jgi:Fe-S-cluster-containing dehydrogenase component
MKKWNLVIDVAECTNCQLCALAAMDEYVDNEWPGYSAPMPRHGHRWIDIREKERGQPTMIDIGYLPATCNHCDNAPCLKAGGPDGAVRKRDDGIVLIDPEKAKGRKDIVDSCPYGAIWWNEDRGRSRRPGRSTRTSSTRAGSIRADTRCVRPRRCVRSSWKTKR